ncbi:PREDICTED: uncharacterized protein LOC105138707 [Populus euphratica]|uniref:Uncharacterized protein LOC105138707 n=1 Tax=Populus euphratica TaxID=75702 RepID=A0AAJ6V8D5_POPEU|nr:PREDICTED: uncharacterized protein LOC105138707 [Populus euphratica]
MKWQPEQIQHHHFLDGQSYAKPFLPRKSHENPDIQHSIDASSTAFGNTELKTMTLHWDEEVTYNISNTFNVIVACDL